MGTELTQRLIELFQWFDPDPDGTHLVSDHSGWWRDPQVLAGSVPRWSTVPRPAAHRCRRPGRHRADHRAAGRHRARRGFRPAYKPDERHLPGPVSWAQGPADYRGRNPASVSLDRHLGSGDRVLVVDDWVATGAQLRAIYTICAARGPSRSARPQWSTPARRR